jgi:hypothetical protein
MKQSDLGKSLDPSGHHILLSQSQAPTCHSMLCFVLDPPLAVEDFSCISENWSSLNCTWREQYNPIRNVSPLNKEDNKIASFSYFLRCFPRDGILENAIFSQGFWA